MHLPSYRSSGAAIKSRRSFTAVRSESFRVLSSSTLSLSPSPSCSLSLIHSKNTCSLSEFSEQFCQPRRAKRGGAARVHAQLQTIGIRIGDARARRVSLCTNRSRVFFTIPRNNTGYELSRMAFRRQISTSRRGAAMTIVLNARLTDN